MISPLKMLTVIRRQAQVFIAWMRVCVRFCWVVVSLADVWFGDLGWNWQTVARAGPPSDVARGTNPRECRRPRRGGAKPLSLALTPPGEIEGGTPWVLLSSYVVYGYLDVSEGGWLFLLFG